MCLQFLLSLYIRVFACKQRLACLCINLQVSKLCMHQYRLGIDSILCSDVTAADTTLQQCNVILLLAAQVHRLAECCRVIVQILGYLKHSAVDYNLRQSIKRPKHGMTTHWNCNVFIASYYSPSPTEAEIKYIQI